MSTDPCVAPSSACMFAARARLKAMQQSWSDLLPTAQEDNLPRLHPTYAAAWPLRRLHVALPRAGAGLVPQAASAAPPAPLLGPAPDPPLRVRPMRRPLPEPLDLDSVDPSVLHLPQPAGSPWSSRALGPSSRLLWVLFWTWRYRWGRYCSLSLPMLGLMGVYVRAYLFREEDAPFLAGLQQLLAFVVPPYAIGPQWLWGLLFGARFFEHHGA